MSTTGMSAPQEGTREGVRRVELLNADCMVALQIMPSCSVDAVVTDPPYHLTSIVARFGAENAAPAGVGATGVYARSAAGFMGQKWDGGDIAFRPAVWAECLRVLKPGGHLLSFGGTRTYHRMACAIEDAGFEVRDQLAWVYGSGFPKSHNLDGEWEGWGTALKPAWEPIVLARKPLDATVATNVLKWGTGALNIGATRVPGAFESGWSKSGSKASENTSMSGANYARDPKPDNVTGRWPANILHDGSDEVVSAFPVTKSGSLSGHRNEPKTKNAYGAFKLRDEKSYEGDSGSAARFFYCAKASRKDRNDGLAEFEERPLLWSSGTQNPGSFQSEGTEKAAKNNHPTVKPTELMRYLCRLVTPPGGTVLDPFMGSGSTGRGAVLEGFGFIGIEQDAHYTDIARARVAAVSPAAEKTMGVFD